MDKLTTKVPHTVRHKASTLPYSQASGPQPGTRRHKGLLALLRRLSPRLKRTPSPDRPWVKVEPRSGDRTSVASDHSFETALQVRHSELIGYDMYHNAHPPQEAPQKSEGTKGSRGGLSGLLTSLRSSKQSQKQAKPATTNSAVEKRSEKALESERQQKRSPEAQEPTENQQNGATIHTYTPMKSQLVDSRSKFDMTTASVPLHTSARPTAAAQRPHTLNLPNRGQSKSGWTAAAGPPPHPQPPLPLLPALSQMTQPTQTTSVDSIGSCSLDVNATGTTSPATMEAVDGSRRSLRSLSLENNLSSANSPGGSVGTTTPLRPILKPQPFTDPGSLKDPGGTTDGGYKTPSYLGISCAVNGYSRLNRYDSSLRDGFRSRDASPARLAFSRSRDSSPMRPEWKVFDPTTKASPQATAAKIRELKEELARFKAELPPTPSERGRQGSSRKLGKKPSQGRSISVDRGYLTKAGSRDNMNSHQEETTLGGQQVRFVEISTSDSSTVKSSSYSYSFEQSVVCDGVCENSVSVHCSSRTNGDTPEKSFIQSRIERLYGPSALAAGFRSRRSLLELEKEQRDRQSAGFRSPASLIDNHFEPEEKAPEGFPSVFRHLRPEFRTQLQVKRNTRLRSDIPLDNSFEIDSPKRPGRVIPITLCDALEKPQTPPPVLLPKPQNLINNKNKLENGVRERGGPQVIVKKIVNGNGNINEMEVPIVKAAYINGGVEEKKESVIIPNESDVRTSTKVNGVTETITVNGDMNKTSKGEKDGHYFLKIVGDVVVGIEADVASIEPDFEACRSEMSEEVRGKVLAAIGKARLLISQKIQQFQGLCHKNIAGSEGEEFPTTNEDLAGFWDMVYIQVEVIRQLLKEIKALKANGWKEIPDIDAVDSSDKNVSTGRARRKPAPRPIRAAKSTKASGEEGKARDEARKKLMEERRKAMKEAMRAKKAEVEAQGDVDNVEIFTPDCK
ncbi:uncharacterized protein [Palaemon carinicauda]|uniref:uncharacterized protein isoform X2 n=1 Tax=Palaemon carinicauda TaxID=392227 RepID=UPI0035B64800